MPHIQFFSKPHWLHQQNISKIYWVKVLEMLKKNTTVRNALEGILAQDKKLYKKIILNCFVMTIINCLWKLPISSININT